MIQVINYQSRFFLLLVSLVSLMHINAQQRQYAIYNYRTDGGINAFINSDIDSITYSNIGLDSILYDNAVVQEIWTSDGVHRIALEDIDSIAFQTPEPKLRENIFHITEQHLTYTISVDSLHILFLSSIPFSLVPQVGQVVISDIDNSPYQDGFAGRVTSVTSNEDGVLITCEVVEIFDIFERLLIARKVVSQSEDEGTNVPKRTRRAEEKRHWWDIYEDDGIEDFIIPVDMSVSVLNGMFSAKTKKPKVTCVWCIDVNPLGYKANFDFLIRHEEISFDMKLSLPQVWKDFSAGDKEDNKEEEDEYGWKRKKLKVKGTYPVVPGLVDIGLEFGLGFKGSLDFDGKWTTSGTQKLNFDIYGKNLDVMMPPIVVIHESDTDFGEIKREASLSLNGGVQLGIKPFVTVKLLSKYLISAEGYVEGGIEANATWQISSKDMPLDFSLYELFKDASLSSDVFVQGGVNAKIANYKVATLKAKKTWEIGKWYMFPHLTIPELPAYQGNSKFGGDVSPTSLTIHPTHSVMKNAILGLGIYDEEGKLIRENYGQYEYDNEEKWKDGYLQMPLNDLRVGYTYTCHPFIQYDLWGLSGKIDVDNLSKEVTIPEKMSVARTEVNLHKAKSSTVEIKGGWGSYEIVNTDSKVANATSLEIPSINKKYVLIKGLKVGTTQVTVTDVRSNATETISVIVDGEDGTLSLAGSSYQLKAGDEKSVEIIDGSGSFTSASSNNDVVKCRIEGCFVVISAISEGTAIITVSDTLTGETAELEVSVVTDEQNDDFTMPTDGLVLYYPFNGNTNDESGYGNHGTIEGDVSYTTGVNRNDSQAVMFNGGRIVVGNPESLRFTDGCTFAMFVKPTEWRGMDGWGYTTSNGNHCIFGKDNDQQGLSFLLSGDSEHLNVNAGSWIYKSLEIGTDNKVEGDYLNKWIHIALVYSSNSVKLYIDGKLINERETTPDFSGINEKNLTIGRFYVSHASPYWWYPLHGAIDEFCVYNRALSLKEVQKLSINDGSMESGGTSGSTDPDVIPPSSGDDEGM